MSGIDFSLDEGEFVCLLGASGCGKSTLLRLLAGLEQADEGRIERRSDAHASFVFQDPTLMPWASVHDNVWLPLRLAGVSRRAAASRVAAQLTRVGLADRAHSLPRALSGGMRMRVSIARALVNEPAVLLMDEPFAALDEITRMRLEEELVNWCATRAMGVVFVTHSVSEAVFLADRIVVMQAAPGRIAREFVNPPPACRDHRWREHPEFAQRCTQLSSLLREVSA